MRAKICLSFLLLRSLTAPAQPGELEQATRLLFPPTDPAQWFQSFKGRVDDLNDVAVVLGRQEKTCRGYLQYLRSRTTFRLEGNWHEGNFWLDEIDSLGNVSGTLNGILSGDSLQASWHNIDHAIGKKFLLKAVHSIDDLPTHCGDNKWVGFFSGNGSEEGMEMILQKITNSQVWGIAYYQNRSFKAHGEIDARQRLSLVLKKPSGNPLGTLEGDFSSDRHFDARLVLENKSEKVFKFQLQEWLAIDCIEYADYVTSYDLTFPKTRSAAFNAWMERQASDRINYCRNQANKTKYERQTPESRASARATGWCDVEYFSQDLISGFFTFQTSWANRQEGMAFNFDLKKGEEIRHKDIFKDIFHNSGFISEVIKTAFQHHSLYQSDENFRAWIATAEFPFFTIRKEGICFSTEFNPIYGRQSLTVPYSELKPYLKENDVLER
jgi:hypothetical protein